MHFSISDMHISMHLHLGYVMLHLLLDNPSSYNPRIVVLSLGVTEAQVNTNGRNLKHINFARFEVN